jgi:hypothetical protein
MPSVPGDWNRAGGQLSRTASLRRRQRRPALTPVPSAWNRAGWRPRWRAAGTGPPARRLDRSRPLAHGLGDGRAGRFQSLGTGLPGGPRGGGGDRLRRRIVAIALVPLGATERVEQAIHHLQGDVLEREVRLASARLHLQLNVELRAVVIRDRPAHGVHDSLIQGRQLRLRGRRTFEQPDGARLLGGINGLVTGRRWVEQ